MCLMKKRENNSDANGHVDIPYRSVGVEEGVKRMIEAAAASTIK